MVELARWEFAQPIKPYSIFTDPVYPNGVMAFSADSASLFVVTAQKDDSAFSALGGGTCFFFEYDFICPPDEGESGHIPCGTVGINRVHLTDGALMEYLPIELTSEPVKWLLSPAGDVLAEFSVAYGCPINLRVLSDSLTGLQITPNIAPFSQGYTDNSLLWIANDQGDVAKYSADMSGFSPAVHLDWKPAASELDGWKANYEDTLVSEDGYGFEAIAMSPYGKYLLTMISNGGSGKVTTQYGVHFSPDGEVMIYLWNLAGNKHVGGFREPLLEWWGSPGSYHPRGVSSAFSPDEKQLAIYQASLPVRVYDPSNGRLISAFGSPDAGYTGLVYTPDSRVLIVVGKFTVELWDPVRGEQLSTLAATGVIENFAISQDGRYLAALTHQGIIQIWGIAP
jgi:WD40 repeat protein